jgi:hypothetical protein
MNLERITPCGECCDGCKKKDEGLCEGCIESGGHCKEWTQSGGCPIYLCAAEHKATFCGMCVEFPCDFLVEKVHWNKSIVADLTALAEQYKQIVEV